MKKIILFLIFLFATITFNTDVYASRIYGCTSLTGGVSGSLDSLDITGASAPNANDLADGDVAFVGTISGINSNFYIYIFDADGTDAESSLIVIRPDDYATQGVWRLSNIILNNIEIGHTSDTTIVRSGSGAITVEGIQVLLLGVADADDFGDGVTNAIVTLAQESNWDDAYNRTTGFWSSTGLTGGAAGDLDAIDGNDITVKDIALVSTRETSASGTTTGTTASKLVDSGGGLSNCKIGDEVYNSTDTAYTTVTAIDSDTQLSLADDIFTSGEAYIITTIKTYKYIASNKSQSEDSPNIIVPDSNPGDLNWDLNGYYLNGNPQYSDFDYGAIPPTNNVWQAVSISPAAFIADGTNCTDPASEQINSGPNKWFSTCSDAAGTLEVSIPMPENWDGGNVYVKMEVGSNQGTPAGTVEFEIEVQSRGAGEVFNSTWVSAVNAQFASAIDTQYAPEFAESAVIATSGAGGDDLAIRITRDNDDGTNDTSTQEVEFWGATLFYQIDDLDERD